MITAAMQVGMVLVIGAVAAINMLVLGFRMGVAYQRRLHARAQREEAADGDSATPAIFQDRVIVDATIEDER